MRAGTSSLSGRLVTFSALVSVIGVVARRMPRAARRAERVLADRWEEVNESMRVEWLTLVAEASGGKNAAALPGTCCTCRHM
jgi:hypothetical protein